MALNSSLSSLPILLLYCLFSLLCVNAATYREFLQIGQSIGTSDTLVSYGGNFELGFFTKSRENSTKYYVGIRFKKVRNDKIVWVANGDYAFQTSTAALNIHPDGNIVVIDGPITYQVNSVPNNYSTYATLLDSGNLVLLNNSNQAILWQSFDNPTDTLLPGMQLGESWSLRSWKSADDPAPGPFQLVYGYGSASLIVNNGSNVFWIDSSSNFSGVFDRMGLGRNSTSTSFFTLADSNSRLVLEVSGDVNYQKWSQEAKSWVSLQSNKCGTDNSCGVFSICTPQAIDPCHCLKGFEPFDADSWRQGNRSAGCVRKKELSCSNISSNANDDAFFQYSTVELPEREVKLKMDTAERCRSTCISNSNCSCIAYSYDFNGYCMLWHDQVLTLRNISTDNGNGNNNHPSFYLRLAALEFVTTGSNIANSFDGHGNSKRNLLIVLLISILILLILLGLFVHWTRRHRRKGDDLLRFEVGMSMKVQDLEFTEADKGAKVKKKEVKLPLFSFLSVSAATNNFSDANKLGEGGFGPVYKGKLLNGDEVAVKKVIPKIWSRMGGVEK